MAESISSPSSSKRFGLSLSVKEGKPKTGRKARNFWGIMKSPSRRHKDSGDDDKEITAGTVSTGSSPLSKSTAAKAPDRVLTGIKHEVKDFARKIERKADSLIHRHVDSQAEEKEEPTPNKTLSESKQKEQYLTASAEDGPPSLLHKESEEAKKPVGGESKPREQDHRPKETHGNSKQIDENTPADEIKAPSLSERVREEVEAVVHTFHDRNKKQTTDESDRKHHSADDPDHHEKGNEEDAPEKRKEDGCECNLAKGLQKICAPWSSKED